MIVLVLDMEMKSITLLYRDYAISTSTYKFHKTIIIYVDMVELFSSKLIDILKLLVDICRHLYLQNITFIPFKSRHCFRINNHGKQITQVILYY